MKILLSLLILFQLTTYHTNAQKSKTKIAFLADVHLQDLFGELSDSEYKGILIPSTDKTVLMRSMEAQLHSTRIFNENYFAFISALEDIVSRDIHIVALPGDYSDDGQPLHIRGLQNILNKYSKKYDLQFFITTGNHDPASPFKQESGKSDFLGKEGKTQPIFSTPYIYKSKSNELPVVVSSDLAKLGYSGITKNLSNFGFTAQPKYAYWATPFSDYTSENYSYKKALKASSLEKRVYKITPKQQMYDMSYVVEVSKNVWLLALDGDTFVPQKNGSYAGSSIGYNNVLIHKPHLVEWVKKIVKEANKRGKTLIAFSHFPMIDFNDDASAEIEALMGEEKFQLNRVPNEKVAQVFANAGLKIHVAGHMHINDTGIRTTAEDNTLINIQAPSLAAYLPGYKILTIQESSIEVETVVLNQVKHYNQLFSLYKTEWNRMQKSSEQALWDSTILETKNYKDFTAFHLKELVRLRFIPNDFPETLRKYLPELSGTTLVLLANNAAADTEEYLHRLQADLDFRQTELEKVNKSLKKINLNLNQFKNFNGMDLICDFYRIRGGDQLAFKEIGRKRLQAYSYLTDTFLLKQLNVPASKLEMQLSLFFKILKKFRNGEPSDHFLIDLKSGSVKALH